MGGRNNLTVPLPFVVRSGVDYADGYAIDKPEPIETYVERLAAMG